MGRVCAPSRSPRRQSSDSDGTWMGELVAHRRALGSVAFGRVQFVHVCLHAPLVLIRPMSAGLLLGLLCGGGGGRRLARLRRLSRRDLQLECAARGRGRGRVRIIHTVAWGEGRSMWFGAGRILANPHDICTILLQCSDGRRSSSQQPRTPHPGPSARSPSARWRGAALTRSRSGAAEASKSQVRARTRIVVCNSVVVPRCIAVRPPTAMHGIFPLPCEYLSSIRGTRVAQRRSRRRCGRSPDHAIRRRRRCLPPGQCPHVPS